MLTRAHAGTAAALAGCFIKAQLLLALSPDAQLFGLRQALVAAHGSVSLARMMSLGHLVGLRRLRHGNL